MPCRIEALDRRARRYRFAGIVGAHKALEIAEQQIATGPDIVAERPVRRALLPSRIQRHVEARQAE